MQQTAAAEAEAALPFARKMAKQWKEGEGAREGYNGDTINTLRNALEVCSIK